MIRKGGGGDYDGGGEVGWCASGGCEGAVGEGGEGCDCGGGAGEGVATNNIAEAGDRVGRGHGHGHGH